jgi:hypothetical protein
MTISDKKYIWANTKKPACFNQFLLQISTVILSFLKRERERDHTVNVILQTFQTVCLVQYDRFIPFTVPDRPPFLTVTMTVPDRFVSVFDRFITFFCVCGRFLSFIFIITGRTCIAYFFKTDFLIEII